VELLAPVEDRGLGAELGDALDRAFADNTSSWELRTDGSWERRSPEGEQESRNLQRELMELHLERSEAASAAAV
jgi:polyphosphate kinase